MNYGGPRNGGVSEDVVVQFRDLAKSTHVENFLEGYELSVAIPMKQVEYKHGTLTLMQIRYPLMLLWDITIHKSQACTLVMAIIDLGNSKKCSDMILVALSRVKNLNIPLFTFFVCAAEFFYTFTHQINKLIEQYASRLSLLSYCYQVSYAALGNTARWFTLARING